MENINAKELLEEKINSDNMVLVYFGNSACGVCVDLKPKVEQMLLDYPKIKSYYIDVEAFPMTAASYSIFTIPGILVFAQGREYVREARHISIGVLKNKVHRYYQMLFN